MVELVVELPRLGNLEALVELHLQLVQIEESWALESDFQLALLKL